MTSSFKRQRLIDRWCKGKNEGTLVVVDKDSVEKITATDDTSSIAYYFTKSYDRKLLPEVITFLNTHISKGNRKIGYGGRMTFYFCLPEDAVEFKLAFL